MHKRVQREKKVISLMVKKYCKEIHNENELCSNCSELLDYAKKRLLKCPFLKNKPVCSNCDIHCYNTHKQEEIKNVMRTVGPKMIYTNTLDALWYFYYKFIHKFQKVT